MRLGLLVVVLLFGGSPVAAQHVSDKPSAAEDSEAKSLFAAGKTAFDSGRFESALEYFEKSYELSHRPALLFNIGTSADRLRMNDKALSSFRNYRRLVPDAENATSVDARIAVLEEVVRRREDARHPEPTKASKLVPTLLLSLGIASFVTGLVLVGVAVRNKNTIEGTQLGDGLEWSDYAGKASRVPALSTAGWIALVFGTVTTGVAVVLFATSKRSKKRVELSFGGNHLKLRGTF